jgi:hypothetical protein
MGFDTGPENGYATPSWIHKIHIDYQLFNKSTILVNTIECKPRSVPGG